MLVLCLPLKVHGLRTGDDNPQSLFKNAKRWRNRLSHFYMVILNKLNKSILVSDFTVKKNNNTWPVRTDWENVSGVSIQSDKLLLRQSWIDKFDEEDEFLEELWTVRLHSSSFTVNRVWCRVLLWVGVAGNELLRRFALTISTSCYIFTKFNLISLI